MAPKPAATNTHPVKPSAPAPGPAHQTTESAKQPAQPLHEPSQPSRDQAKQPAPESQKQSHEPTPPPHEAEKLPAHEPSQPTPPPHEAGKQPAHEPSQPPQEQIKKPTVPVTPAAPSKGNAPPSTGKEPQHSPPPTTTGGSGTKSNIPPAQNPEPTQGAGNTPKSPPSHVSGQTPTPADTSSNPLVQAKIAHSERVASEILSYLDWNLEHQEPYEFTPFPIFVSESLLPRTEQYVQQHLAGQTPSTATQMAKNGSTINGKVWKVNDETKATALRTWVQQLHPMAYLGADMFTLNGEEQACRVIAGV